MFYTLVKVSLNQWFSSFAVHQQWLEGLLKQFTGIHPQDFWGLSGTKPLHF